MAVPEAPEWLNDKFVETALRKGFKDSKLTIDEAKFEPAVAVGDNYGSQMLRGTIKLRRNGDKEDQVSIVLKLLPKADFMQEHMNMEEIFEIEIIMFSEVLPNLPGISNKFFAEAYYTQIKPTPAIVLEDLKPKGYVLGDRQNGFDLAHCELVMKALATLHSSSYALLQQKPELKDRLSKCFYSKEYEVVMKKFLTLNGLISSAQTWEEFPKKYVDKLKKLEPILFDRTCDVYKRNDDKLNVILHGDAWPGNMLFKYKDNVPEHIILVDYQTSNYNHPCLDLNYFLFNGPKQSVRDQHLDYLLELYHSQFTKLTNELNCKVDYSLDDLKNDFNHYLSFGLICGLCIYPMTSAPPDSAKNISDILEKGEEINDGLFEKNKVFRQVITKMLDYFDKKGVF